ncbi:phage tail protein [Streptomyces sp. NPDC057927]
MKMIPRYWLAKPNKSIISRIKEIDENSSLKLEFLNSKELTGTIPRYIWRNGKSIENEHFTNIRNKYLIKMEFLQSVEWFVIENVEKSDSEGNSISFTAYSLEYSLRGKKLGEMKIESEVLSVAFNTVLERTTWRLGDVSGKVSSKYRSFEFSYGNNVLEALYEMANSYNAILEFDTVKKIVHVRHEEEICVFRNLMLNPRNYIKTLTDGRESNDVVTRLTPIGYENLTINEVSPTGNSYIENFSYFMYPFKRDSNKDVVSHSDYMSDELCHAILNQQEAIALINPQIQTKMAELTVLQEATDPIESDIDAKLLDFDTVQARLDVMRQNAEYYYDDMKISGNSKIEILRTGYYVLQGRSKSGYGSVNINGTTVTFNSGWTHRLYNYESLESNKETKFPITLTSGTVEYYIARIPKSEYDTFTNEQYRDRYNIMYRGELLELAQLGLSHKASEIQAKRNELANLHESIHERHFFTKETLEEKIEFTFDGEYEEANHTDAQELYDDSVEKLKDLCRPNINMTIDIYNFLEALEHKHNWKKLQLGHKIRVRHPELDIYSEAIIAGISYDFSSADINITLSETKDMDDYDKKAMRMLYDASSAALTLSLNKFLYDDAKDKANWVSDFINGEWDANLRRIHAGINESVEISKRGIIIRNPDYPNEMLIAQSGILTISNDGGQTFKNAITKDGVIAQRLVGKAIIGERLIIQDDDGTITLKGSLQTIKDRYGTTKALIGEYERNKFGVKLFDGAFEIHTKGDSSYLGVVLDKDGLRSYDNSGKLMFNLDSNDGSAMFAGDLSAAGGTFTGTLHGVDGIFTGTLQAVDGTFTGTLQAVDGVFTGTLYTGNEESYTRIEGGEFDSYGTYTKSWGRDSADENNSVHVKIQNGSIRMRNETKDWSLYFSDMGISTYENGIGSASSGTIMFRDTTYSDSAKGITMHSTSGVVALVSENNGIVMSPRRTAVGENNSFRFSVKEDSDGVLYYGGDKADTYASGIIFARNADGEGKYPITITDSTGGKETGFLYSNTMKSKTFIFGDSMKYEGGYLKGESLELGKNSIKVNTMTVNNNLTVSGNTTVSGTLSVGGTNVGNKLSSLESSIGTVRSSVSGINSEINSLNSQINSLWNAISRLS